MVRLWLRFFLLLIEFRKHCQVEVQKYCYNEFQINNQIEVEKQGRIVDIKHGWIQVQISGQIEVQKWSY